MHNSHANKLPKTYKMYLFDLLVVIKVPADLVFASLTTISNQINFPLRFRAHLDSNKNIAKI